MGSMGTGTNSSGGMGTGGYVTSWGTRHGRAGTAKEFNEDGDLSRFEYLAEKDTCPPCGQMCDHHKYYIDKFYPPAVSCMDCDCGYVYVSDSLTDGKYTAFIRSPGSPGVILINGGAEEFIITEKQAQRIIETRLVYTKRKEGEYNYTGSDGKQGVCHIERIGNLVIATELKENKGVSITDACEAIASEYAESAGGIVLENLIFVERYDGRKHGYSKSSLERVVFNIISVGYRRLIRGHHRFSITERELEKLKREAMY